MTRLYLQLLPLSHCFITITLFYVTKSQLYVYDLHNLDHETSIRLLRLTVRMSQLVHKNRVHRNTITVMQ